MSQEFKQQAEVRRQQIHDLLSGGVDSVFFQQVNTLATGNEAGRNASSPNNDAKHQLHVTWTTWPNV